MNIHAAPVARFFPVLSSIETEFKAGRSTEPLASCPSHSIRNTVLQRKYRVSSVTWPYIGNIHVHRMWLSAYARPWMVRIKGEYDLQDQDQIIMVVDALA